MIELTGAVLILTAFVLAQFGRLATASLTYMVLNFVGSAILAFTAAVDGDVGFLLLEGVWAIVSGYSIARFMLRR
ncbi:MAG TPA: hypothetical protein VGV86_01690 [Acidimicrobiales bacterium]|nr:hypothetical protein [Acidimicrobiales bacterium]